MSEEQMAALLGALAALTSEIAGLRADLAERAEQPVVVVVAQPEPEPEPPQPIRGNARERRRQQ